MKFSVVTIFPEMIQETLKRGLIGSALRKKLIEVHFQNPREFTTDFHKTVDDRPFGGGDGMTMMAGPLIESVKKLQGLTTQKGDLSLDSSSLSKCDDYSQSDRSPKMRTIYLSPQGKILNHKKVKDLLQYDHLILVCGRYGGVDQRFINSAVDEEISIGDYVLSGGELAASVVIDAVSRQIRGVLGHHESADLDSLSDSLKGYLEAPQFTRPHVYLGESVPQTLISGHHSKIEEYKAMLSVLITFQKRPDLLKGSTLTRKERDRILDFWKNLQFDEKRVLGLKEAIFEDEKFLKFIEQGEV